MNKKIRFGEWEYGRRVLVKLRAHLINVDTLLHRHLIGALGGRGSDFFKAEVKVSVYVTMGWAVICSWARLGFLQLAAEEDGNNTNSPKYHLLSPRKGEIERQLKR